METGSRYTHLKIAKDKDQDVNKLFEALAVFQRINMEEITPLLLKNVTATATNGFFKKPNEVQWAEHIDWQMDYSELEIRYNELKLKMATIKPTDANELEKQRRMLITTDQKLLEQTKEMSRLKTHVKSVEEESTLLKIQLQDKEKELLKQTQGRNLNMENEQLQMKLKDLQRKLDNIEHVSQRMIMNKTEVENENKKLSDMLRKTEHEFSEQKFEISRLKKRVKSVDEESRSLKKQLQEKEMQLLKQKQGKILNVGKEQLEVRHKDLQQKFDKISDEYQAMEMVKTRLENESEKLMCTLRKTEEEFSEQKSEISRLKTRVDVMNEESKALKAQLHDKEVELLKQKQRRDFNVENEQLDMRQKDLQQKFDKIRDEYKSMAMDKTKLENENEKLIKMLRKTEQEISEKENEISRLKKDVESRDEEIKSLKAQLQENKMQLIKQRQEINMNEENEQLEMKHKDLQQKFDEIKDENEKLRSMLRKTEQDFSEKTTESSRLKKRVESLDQEIKSLKAREKEMQLLQLNKKRTWSGEYEQLELRHTDLQRKFDKIKDDSQAMMLDKSRLESENEKLSTMLKKSGQESLDQKSEISRLKKRIDKMDQESESFKAHLQEKERQLQEQKLATKKAYAEKDDALTRLSRHMGQQMSEGNPNITDLSDKNRPSKLGERYSELYDNEWTDAFECLTDKFYMDIDDKSGIEILRKILLESYKSAFTFSLSQMKEAEYKLSGSSKEVSPECKRLLKEARKHVDIKRADSLLADVVEGSLRKVIDRRYLNETKVQEFASECVQLCWLMAIQDPPVVLAEDPVHGSRFDTNIYKHYTNSGDTFDYIVWPALLLHKGGPLLTKGVAQPFPRTSQMSASAVGKNKITEYGMFDNKNRPLSDTKYKP
ncbi:hypothetical protein CHS0354_026362 [Potamilus streckersoni]|uniref:Mitochondria-eating protein n=1 Tax=Potamilus streckersoni TaxID=2493646 RepID=A0AAE0T326_9BIVA|nr:hypothetical protein CHS0354_026362 [Potamilus streckersoni]